MKKPSEFFKRKKKDEPAPSPSGRTGAGLQDEGDEDIIDLDEIIDDAAGDDALTASKLGLDVNLEEIDLDDDAFGKEFDAEENALLNAVDLSDGEDTLKETDLDAEFRALLGDELNAAGPAGEAVATVAQAPAAEPPVAPPAREDEVLTVIEDTAPIMEPPAAAPARPEPAPPVAVAAPSPEREEPPSAEPVAVAPRLDEEALERLLDEIEERLQQAIRRTVAEQLPAIVRAILQEEIERLKDNGMS